MHSYNYNHNLPKVWALGHDNLKLKASYMGHMGLLPMGEDGHGRGARGWMVSYLFKAERGTIPMRSGVPARAEER